MTDDAPYGNIHVEDEPLHEHNDEEKSKIDAIKDAADVLANTLIEAIEAVEKLLTAHAGTNPDVLGAMQSLGSLRQKIDTETLKIMNL